MGSGEIQGVQKVASLELKPYWPFTTSYLLLATMNGLPPVKERLLVVTTAKQPKPDSSVAPTLLMRLFAYNPVCIYGSFHTGLMADLIGQRLCAQGPAAGKLRSFNYGTWLVAGGVY